MQDTIKTQVEETLAKAEEVYKTSFNRIPIDFTLTGKSAGRFHCKNTNNGEVKEAKLSFNLSMAILNKDNFKSTVIHEIAHYIARVKHGTKVHHGPEWKAIMMKLGADPKRCHDYEMPADVLAKTPYKYFCGCQFHYLSARKHTSGNKQFCRICKQECKFLCHINEETEEIKNIVPVKFIKPSDNPLEIRTYDLPAPKSSAQAMKDGDVLYWSGTPCINGHKSPRYTRDDVCKECYRLKKYAQKMKKEAELVAKAAEKAA